MRILLLSFFVSFLSFAGASAQTADQLAAKRLAFWTDVISGKIKPREYLCHESLIPSNGIRLDVSSLDDAIKVYGKNTIVKTGDASTSEATLCYVGKDSSILAFSSNEMHGGNVIADVSVFAAGADSYFFDCKNSDKVSSSIQASGGLKLGMSKAEVESLYGKASKAAKYYNLYRYDAKVKPNPQALSDDNNFCVDSEEILIHFKDEKVDWFSLRHNAYC